MIISKWGKFDETKKLSNMTMLNCPNRMFVVKPKSKPQGSDRK